MARAPRPTRPDPPRAATAAPTSRPSPISPAPDPDSSGAKAAPAAPATPAAEDALAKKKKKKVREEVPVAKPVEAEEPERKKKKKKKLRHKEVDQAEVQDAIRRTFAAMDEAPAGGRALSRKRKRREREEAEQRLQEEAQRESGKLRVTEFVSVSDLANLMRVNVSDVIKKCMELGIMVSINQRLDKDTITLVADEFGFEIQFFTEVTEDEALEEHEDLPETLRRRPPIVTIPGPAWGVNRVSPKTLWYSGRRTGTGQYSVKGKRRSFRYTAVTPSPVTANTAL